MQESHSKTKTIVNKISRFSPVVFIRRYVFLFILLIIIFFSFLLGLWNVRNIEFELPEDSYTDINKLKESADSVKGKNIFLISVDELESKLKEKNGFVKRITVEKRIPFTLHVLVDEYTPSFMGYSSEKCVLFSREGVHLKELCTECSEECIQYLNEYSSMYITSNSALEGNGKLIYAEEIGDILKILSTFGYSIKSLSINDGIATFEDFNGHTFTFDITENLNIQLNRVYIVGKKINSESMEFKSLDLRFDRPVMRLE